MNRFTVSILLAFFMTGLSACADNAFLKRDAGTLLGAAAGGLLGSQFGGGTGKLAMTAFGALTGAFIGGNIGKTMDDVDRLKTSHALETSPTGQSVAWVNPDTGVKYRVTPTHTHSKAKTNERICRDYVTEAWIDGKKESVHGTACRKADGSWRAV